MNILKAINLIGKPIYTYEVDYGLVNSEVYIYEDKIFAIGKDFVYVNNDDLIEKAKIHYFEDYGTEWFVDKEECERFAYEEREFNNRY